MGLAAAGWGSQPRIKPRPRPRPQPCAPPAAPPAALPEHCKPCLPRRRAGERTAGPRRENPRKSPRGGGSRGAERSGAAREPGGPGGRGAGTHGAAARAARPRRRVPQWARAPPLPATNRANQGARGGCRERRGGMRAALRRLGGAPWPLWPLRASQAAPRPRCVGPGSAPAPRCWSCGAALPRAEGPPHFCPGCRALQPPGPRPDLFRLMGCARSFRIDAQQLQRRFRSLQRAVHPDRFGQRPPEEQYYSEQHSSLINKAYQTLLNPLSRGLYLLELKGVEPAQETDSEADSEFLSEIMEINEKLAEPKNEDTLEDIETLLKVKQEELTKEVTAAFERDDLQEAKKLLGKMKYFANLEDKLKKKKIPS